MFFTLENIPEFCELLMNENWLEKLSYLAGIFSHLNQINSSMQGPNKNILTSCSKLFTLKAKLKIGKKRVKKINLMFILIICNTRKFRSYDIDNGAFNCLRRKYRQVLS